MAVFAGQVAASSDDAAEQLTGSVPNLTETGIGMSADGAAATRRWCGLRFLNLTIPRGVVVSAADIQLQHTGGTKNDDIDITIQAEAVDDATTFTTGAGDIDTRTRTTASVIWTATFAAAVQFNVSPDISTVIQEVLNRALWVSGNDLNIILQARSTSIGQFDTFDGGSAKAAKLDITYTLHAPPQPRVLEMGQAVNRGSTY